jgi:toxin ParE1/3/4
MSGRIIRKPRAKCDVVEIAEFLGEDSPHTAERFLSALEVSLEALLAMPDIGRCVTIQNPKLAGVRRWPVIGFEKVLIFYRPDPVGIEVLRVLHGARDLHQILAGKGRG